MTHAETSMNTKRVLAEALKESMKQKAFPKITVSELVQRCGMNRKTFYYHFEDIYALLKWVLEEESIAVVKEFDLLADYEEAIVFVMDYVEENEHILSCAYDSIGRDELKRFFCADFLEISRSLIEQAETVSGKALDRAYKEFLAQFYVSAVADVLIEWARDRERRSRAAVVSYLSATIRGSLTGILQDAAYAEQPV